MLKRFVWLGILGFAISGSAQAVFTPPCVDRAGDPMQIDNERVLEMKDTTENQYLDRGFVSGKVVALYEDRTGHEHFSVQIGPGAKDTIEIVFNEKFGNAEPVLGMRAIACGDYITAHAPAGGYEASPDDAIIHWVHHNPKDKGHPHGYIVLEQDLLGYKPGWEPAGSLLNTFVGALDSVFAPLSLQTR